MEEIRMKSTREYNYDWLRVLAMLGVIVIHVSVTWIGHFSIYVSNGGSVSELSAPMMSCIYNSLARFAVPCFMMLTGAFVLADEKTANYKEFYKKKMIKIGTPLVIFSLLYILYRLLLFVIDGDVGMEYIVTLVKDIAKGEPYYHMWYLFMLFEFYLMAPVVVRFKDSITYESFRKVVFVFLIVGSISRWMTEDIKVSWSIGQSFEYLGYFMAGYVMRRDLPKNNRKGFFLIGIGVLIELVTAVLQYQFQIVRGIAESELQYQIIAPYAPLIVIASVLIFAGFTMLQVGYHAWIGRLASMSFLIYLFHSGVWDALKFFMYFVRGRDSVLSLNNQYWIPVFVIATLLISLLLTVIYQRIEAFIVAKIACISASKKIQ